MSKASDEYSVLSATIHTYFEGLYHSDVAKLKNVFDTHATIVGYYEGEHVRHSLAKYLQFVQSISAPSQIGEDYEMEIINISQKGPIAMVRVRLLYEALYHTEILSLMKMDNQWRIVQKLFCHD